MATGNQGTTNAFCVTMEEESESTSKDEAGGYEIPIIRTGKRHHEENASVTSKGQKSPAATGFRLATQSVGSQRASLSDHSKVGHEATAVMSSNAGGFVVPTTAAAASSISNVQRRSLIIQSVIQHLCQFYEPSDSENRRRLFVKICSSFIKAHVFDPEEAQTFSRPDPLRDDYTRIFEKIVQVAHADVIHGPPPDAVDGGALPQTGTALLAMGLPPPPKPQPTPIGYASSFAFHLSRYATEFEQIEFIAKGGFGSVFKARNRLDHVTYAVKKIVLKHRSGKHFPHLFGKILREVTTLARLTHPNIVCYKTAWMEPDLPTTTSCNKAASPTLEYPPSGESEGSGGPDMTEDYYGESWSAAVSQSHLHQINQPNTVSNNAEGDSIIFQEPSVDQSFSQGDGIIFAENSGSVLNGHPDPEEEEISDDGIVFLNTSSSISTYTTRRATSRMATAVNVLSIREVDSSEDPEFTQNCERVQGLAATPPNAPGLQFAIKGVGSNSSLKVNNQNTSVFTRCGHYCNCSPFAFLS